MRQSPRQPLNKSTPLQKLGKQQFISYHKSRRALDEKSKTDRRPKSKFDLSRLSLILTSLVIAICLLYSTFLSGSAKVIIANPENMPSLRDKQEYSLVIDEILASSVLNKNKITINPSELENKILSKFPEIERVTVALPILGHRPVVEATISRAQLLLVSSSGSYILNTDGKAIASLKNLPSGTVLDLPKVIDQAQLEIADGKGALTKQDVTFITTLVKQLDLKNIEIEELILPALASELDIRIKGQPYKVKFSLLNDARLSAGQFIAFYKNLESLNINPTKYIDVRVEERVYYK